MIKIHPTILNCDYGIINEEVASIEDYADALHYDVMDGHFVPNLTMGSAILKSIKTSLIKDVHLMVTNPRERFDEFIDAGANIIAVHIEVYESPEKLKEDIEYLESKGVQPSIAVDGQTPIEELISFFEKTNYQPPVILLMAINAGFGGQPFMPEVLEKIRKLRDMGFSGDIAIDGGVNEQTASECIKAGANVLGVGTTIFGQNAADRGKMIEKLRNS